MNSLNSDIKKNILLIEDNTLNREMLGEILSPRYNIVYASNGVDGLDILKSHAGSISLILLDIFMPIMDGYEFLDIFRKNPDLSRIPIIVTTSSADATEEIKCLDYGATDFVAKPYNADVVLRRVNRIIELCESAALINKTEIDDLTGLYNKGFFFAHAESMLLQNFDAKYDLVRTGIRALRVINNRYGMQKGNELIAALGKFVSEIPDAICGCLGGDSVVAIFPHQSDEFYDDLLIKLAVAVKHSSVPNAVVQLGLCMDIDHKSSIAVSCDNALLAISSIKQNHEVCIAKYDDAIIRQLVREHMITDFLEPALEGEQFHVYYQMKYDLQRDCIGGAEALVRWIHPDLGFMSPGEFIPLFEKNRSIYKLDMYMLDHVCTDLRTWIDEGRKVVPISINISRVDFDDPNLTSRISEIAQKHNVPHDLIHIEVTESAYAENPELIYKGVEELRAMNFFVELDDFGAGYSSLTVLDTLNFEVLKLDISLVGAALSEKRRLILEHIFSITKHLQMSVVAEGVETEEQVRAFKSMGCNYAQGYYYSKPIPKGEFERFLVE